MNGGKVMRGILSRAAFRTPANPWDMRSPLCITNLQNVSVCKDFLHGVYAATAVS